MLIGFADQPEFAKFLLLAHYSVMKGEHRSVLIERISSEIKATISQYSEASLLKSAPAELMMSLDWCNRKLLPCLVI